jgi:hypothetical protein
MYPGVQKTHFWFITIPSPGNGEWYQSKQYIWTKSASNQLDEIRTYTHPKSMTIHLYKWSFLGLFDW